MSLLRAQMGGRPASRSAASARGRPGRGRTRRSRVSAWPAPPEASLARRRARSGGLRRRDRERRWPAPTPRSRGPFGSVGPPLVGPALRRTPSRSRARFPGSRSRRALLEACGAGLGLQTSFCASDRRWSGAPRAKRRPGRCPATSHGQTPSSSPASSRPRPRDAAGIGGDACRRAPLLARRALGGELRCLRQRELGRASERQRGGASVPGGPSGPVPARRRADAAAARDTTSRERRVEAAIIHGARPPKDSDSRRGRRELRRTPPPPRRKRETR